MFVSIWVCFRDIPLLPRMLDRFIPHGIGESYDCVNYVLKATSYITNCCYHWGTLSIYSGPGAHSSEQQALDYLLP